MELRSRIFRAFDLCFARALKGLCYLNKFLNFAMHE